MQFDATVPNVIDRVVQQALLQVLEGIFEPTFHPSSHGFRPDRGAHTGIAEAREHLRAGYQTVVDFDLAQFFDRVHHQRLLDRLGQRIADRRVIDLVRLMLKAAVVMPDGTRIVAREGTPQGGPLSPLLSNVVLDELDQELARRGRRFVRYADDCNVFVRSARAGHRVMASITKFLEGRMRLQVNAEKSAVRHPSKVHFLGFRFAIREDAEIAVLLSAKAERRLAATIREMTPPNWVTLHLQVHGGDQPISDRLDGALPAVYAGSREAPGGFRCPHTPPDQSDYCAPQEASTLSFSAPFGAWCKPICCSRRRVLRPGSMAPIEPAGPDASLSTVLVRRTAHLAEDSVGGAQHPAGIIPAFAGPLMDQPKEPDAGPHVRFCERRDGAIHCAYSTQSPPGADFSVEIRSGSRRCC